MGPAKGFLHYATFSQSFLLLPQLKAEAKKGNFRNQLKLEAAILW